MVSLRYLSISRCTRASAFTTAHPPISLPCPRPITTASTPMKSNHRSDDYCSKKCLLYFFSLQPRPQPLLNRASAFATTVPPPPPQPCPRPDNCTTTLTPPNRVSGPYLEYNLCTFCECDIDPSMFGVIGDCESIHPTTMTWIRTLVVTDLLLQRH